MLFREFITESFSVFLLEYNRAKTLENWGAKLEPWVKIDRMSVDDCLTKLENADPTSNKQYVQWLIKAYLNDSLIEDLVSRGKDNLIKFELLKKKKLIKPEHADIGKFKNLEDLENAMEQYELPQEENTDKGDSSIIEDNDQFKVIIPHDQKAACYYGQGTRWCTAAKSNNQFNTYNKDGDLVIIIPKKPKYTGEKYQLHRSTLTQTMMDEKDEEISQNALKTRFPSIDLHKIMSLALSHDGSGHIKRDEIKRRVASGKLTPQRALGLFSNQYNTSDIPTKELEAIIAKDAATAYNYAKNVLNERFPEAEPTIVKNSLVAYLYAREVIKGRWLEAENIILTDFTHAIAYARGVMQGRWPELEKKILEEDRSFIIDYMVEIMPGKRWLEAEQTILKFKVGAYATKYIGLLYPNAAFNTSSEALMRLQEMQPKTR